MDSKTLERTLDYLSVIQLVYSVPQETIIEGRTFFEYLKVLVPLKEWPDIYLVSGEMGYLSIHWETSVDPLTLSYDAYRVIFRGDGVLDYHSNLEGLGTSYSGSTPLTPDLSQDIIKHMKYFRDIQDEQRQIQKLTAPKSSSYKRMQ